MPLTTKIQVRVSDDGTTASATLGDEFWCFVVCRSPRGSVYLLSLCLYSNLDGTWDGMASQNQSRRRIDQPKQIPRDVAIAVFDVVGWPVSPEIL